MPIFKIKKFIELDGGSDLVEWHNSLDESGKAVFLARMEYLCACDNPAERWSLPYCRPLDDGITEIRFKNRKVQQRPLGYFGPNIKEFTFLFPATEKGNKFIPKDAINRATDRKELVEKDPRRSNGWDIKLDQ